MNTVDRPEGFKEKRAELTVQQIQSVGGSFNTDPLPSATVTPSFTETAPRQPSSASRPPQHNKRFPLTSHHVQRRHQRQILLALLSKRQVTNPYLKRQIMSEPLIQQ